LNFLTALSVLLSAP